MQTSTVHLITALVSRGPLSYSTQAAQTLPVSTGWKRGPFSGLKKKKLGLNASGQLASNRRILEPYQETKICQKLMKKCPALKNKSSSKDKIYRQCVPRNSILLTKCLQHDFEWLPNHQWQRGTRSSTDKNLNCNLFILWEQELDIVFSKPVTQNWSHPRFWFFKHILYTYSQPSL